MNYLKFSLVTGALIALMMGVSGAGDGRLRRGAAQAEWRIRTSGRLLVVTLP